MRTLTTVRRLHSSRPALLVLLLCAALYACAAGDVVAQEHGSSSDDHGADSGSVEESHAAPADAHATPADHGQATESHGEDAHGAPADAHAAEGEHGEGDAHGDGHGGAMPHLPNALTFIKQWTPDSVDAKLDKFLDPIFSLTMALLLALVFVLLSRKLDPRKPGRLQMAVEMLLGGLYSLFETIIGPSARRYTPYLGSLFIFILFNNLFGIVPLGHAATSSFANTTFALGGLTFLYVQFIALKENGIGGWLFHLAGSPRSGVEWGLVVLFFPLHVIGELIKPLSLSLRLFGNIFGEDTLVATMVLLGAGISYSLSGGISHIPGLPLQFPFYFLGLLSCTIQALVFTLLSTVYIALWLPHEHHDEAHAH
ncbi:MAG: F0F1 ATP synthase subunit A [bacterium]|nr:F0F1 ATP synthase subunit A [bacterium]